MYVYVQVQIYLYMHTFMAYVYIYTSINEIVFNERTQQTTEKEVGYWVDFQLGSDFRMK